MILDGKKVRDELLKVYAKEVEDKKLDLSLAVIYVGNNLASEKYISNKIKYSEKCHIKTKVYRLESVNSEEEIIEVIEKLNNDPKITGIILQSPIPNGLDIEKCIEHISPQKDVDGFTKDNFYKLAHNINCLHACTPKGIIKLLEYYDIKLKGKKVCIIGRGNIVGKPLIWEFLNKDATVTITHSKTEDLKGITLNSDIIVCAAGKEHMLKKDMVKSGAIVIDVGINVIDGKIVGDVCFDELKDKCSYITPNPGGVGPMTIAMIMENVITAGKKGEENG